MSKKKQPPQDHDSPWKEALEAFFQSFLQLLYPDIHDAIDWTVQPLFLDKELQQINHKANTGRRYADKLVKDGKTRADSLIGFYRLAIGKNLERELIGRLVIFLEWMVALPAAVIDYYDEQLEILQEETAMSYVSSFERKALEKGILLGEERGLEKGIEQGREEGIGQGSLGILLKQLTRRFGELDQATLQTLHGASTQELERWAENILDAQTLEEVFTLH